MTNAHLEGYQPGGVMNVTGGKKFHEIIAPLFAKSKRSGIELALFERGKNIEMSTSKVYYDPARPSAFST